MRIVTTKAQAARKVLQKLKEGKLSGCRYIRVSKGLPRGRATTPAGGNESAAFPAGNRCGIGWLMSRKEALELEVNGRDYPMVRHLIEDGRLVVDDRRWFVSLQTAVDAWGGPEGPRSQADARALIQHCEDALKETAP